MEQARTMKAWVYERYGSPDVLELRDLDVPTPKDDQVLLRVRAAGINAADWRLLRANPVWSTYSEATIPHEFKHLLQISPENLIGAPHAAFRW